MNLLFKWYSTFIAKQQEQKYKKDEKSITPNIDNATETMLLYSLTIINGYVIFSVLYFKYCTNSKIMNYV